MMKKYKFWIISIAYCLMPIALALCLSLLVRRLPDVGQPHENTQLWIYAGHPISQTITPKNNGLNVITVYLKNVSIRNTDPFYFSLTEGQISVSSVPIREINLSGYNIGDGDNVRFQFAPIPDSQNKPFTLTLSSNSPKDTAIGVGFSDQAQSIAYQTYYYPTSRLQVLSSTLTNFLNRLANLRFIVSFVITAIISTWIAKKFLINQIHLF